MAFRNGIVADTLRKAGLSFGIIFGLQLPQLKKIAADIKAEYPDMKDLEFLAKELIADNNVRESRILGFAIMPAECVTYDKAVELCNGILSREEADLLPFLLLRNTPLIPRLLDNAEIYGEFADYVKETLTRFL